MIAIDRDESALAELEGYDSVVPLVCDLATVDPLEVASMVLGTYGPVAAFAANAGVSTRSTFLEMSPDEFDLVMNVNLRCHWFLAQAFCRDLIARDMAGSVVFTTSVHQFVRRGYPHYSASKAAIGMLVREAAAELGPYGIRVNAVAPGFTTAPGDKLDQRALGATPIGRPIRPDEVADAIGMLLSSQLGGVTGATLVVDGGLSTHSWVDHEPPLA